MIPTYNRLKQSLTAIKFLNNLKRRLKYRIFILVVIKYAII